MTGPGEYTMPPRLAAKALYVAASTLTSRALMGCIPSARTEGGHRRYRPADVQAIADAGTWPPVGTYQDAP